MGHPRHPSQGDHLARAEDRGRYHPVRAAILSLLARDEGRERSAEELRAELSNDTGTVTYHLRVLCRLQLIDAGEEGEQLYRLA